MIINKNIVYFLLIFFLLGPLLGYVTLDVFGNNYLYVLTAFIYLGFIIFIFFSFSEKRHIKLPKYTIFYLLFVLYMLLSDLIIVNKGLTIKYFYSDSSIPSALLLIMVNNVDYSKKFISSVLKLFTFLVIISTIVMVIQGIVDPYFFGNTAYYSFLKGVSWEELQPPSIYSWVSPVASGFTFLSLLVLLIDVKLKNRQIKNLLFLYLLGGIYSFLSRARWIILNYAFVILPYVFQKRKDTKIILFFKLGLLSIIIVSSSFFVLRELNFPVEKVFFLRIMETDSGGIGSGTSFSRIYSAIVFYELFPEHPYFGKGKSHTFGEFSGDRELQSALGGMSSQIHIGFLSLLYYYGLIGGALFILFLFYLMKELLRVAKQTDYYGSFFAFLGYIVANLTLVYLSIYDAGLILAIVFHIHYSNSTTTINNKKQNLLNEF